MKASFRLILFSVFLSFGMLFTSNIAVAQCSLCASSVSGSVKSNVEKAGLGLNKGIIMLLIMPYTVAGIIAVLWYTNSRAKKRRGVIQS